MSDDELTINGVTRNEDGEFYRCGYDHLNRPIDPTGNSFNPHAGSQEPIEGKCGRVLSKHKIRYGKPRYCTQYQLTDKPVCVSHENLYMKPSELMEHGLFARTLENFYQGIPAQRKLYIWMVFDDLCEQSIFMFEPKEITVHIDCTDDPYLCDSLDDDSDGIVELEVRQPTAQTDRALSLWLAAIDRVKMIGASASIIKDGLGDAEITHAQLDDAGDYVTIEQDTEHHLNLPYSRLSRDIQELLAYGGVGVEDPTEEMPSQVVEIYNDPLDTQSDGFTFDDAAQIIPE